MPSRNISLTDHFDSFVEQSVRAGRFANASEVVRAGLHLLERQEQQRGERRASLDAATADGFDALAAATSTSRARRRCDRNCGRLAGRLGQG